MTEPLAEYRQHLVLAEQKSQEAYDKTLLTLSGGALGLSFTFLKDIVQPNPINQPAALTLAWACWVVSVSVLLASFFSSRLALKAAISALDDDRLNEKSPGGRIGTFTQGLNVIGGVTFVSGVICMAVFVTHNLR